jgi:hypothetical protein
MGLYASLWDSFGKEANFALGNKWVCKVGLIEQPLATQPRQCNQAPKCPTRNFIGCLEGIVLCTNFHHWKAKEGLYSLATKSY